MEANLKMLDMNERFPFANTELFLQLDCARGFLIPFIKMT